MSAIETNKSGENADKTETTKNVAEAEEKRIRVRYQGEWYDITNFDHPGGRSILAMYDGKDIDDEIEQAHATDEPKFLLMNARKNGKFEGIVSCQE